MAFGCHSGHSVDAAPCHSDQGLPANQHTQILYNLSQVFCCFLRDSLNVKQHSDSSAWFSFQVFERKGYYDDMDWYMMIYDDIWWYIRWYIRWYGHIWTILQIAYFQDRVISSEQRGSQSSSNSDHAGPVAAAHYPLQASRHSESQSHGKAHWNWWCQMGMGRIKSAEQRKEPMFQDVSTADGPRGMESWNQGDPGDFHMAGAHSRASVWIWWFPNMKFGYFMVIISNHVKHRETKNRSAKFRCDHFVAFLLFRSLFDCRNSG